MRYYILIFLLFTISSFSYGQSIAKEKAEELYSKIENFIKTLPADLQKQLTDPCDAIKVLLHYLSTIDKPLSEKQKRQTLALIGLLKELQKHELCAKNLRPNK
ncbi:MAG: hypothetical protein WDZ41_04890 [Candidatus Babeliales bacterium]